MTESSGASALRVAEIQGRGRALVASQPIKPGQIILQESPILLYSNAVSRVSVSLNFCSHCFRRIDPPTLHSRTLSCPSCSHHAHFCSPPCRSAALTSSHSPWVCETLTRLRSSPSPDPDLQIQSNFLIAAFNLSVVSPSDFQKLISLQGEASPNIEAATLHSLISSLSSNFASFSLELTAALLAKDKQNAFGLMELSGDGERSVRAYGIYPTASFFNHDCLPNACRFDYVDGHSSRNTDIIVRAIHDIARGREVCLSYFPVNWSYKDRQKRLVEDYGFVCGCDRCQVESNWKNEEGEEEAGMEEDADEEMEEPEEEDIGQDDTDFPHAYFFVKYLCGKEGCGGTLAPMPPSEGPVSNVMECNVCGELRKEEDMEGDDGEEEGMSIC
ncbi:histone-lysine N-methyltransferase ASHR2 [Aristolochia californica]|uniref:histone-lysine N-methyltransferase ASHR2 n=1 Tax=Aristolochia californica TaxID=171875 RepID=UPI0035E22EAF